MIPGGFVAALDWLYGTRRSWSRLRKGSVRRNNFLAVAIRLTEVGAPPEWTS